MAKGVQRRRSSTKKNNPTPTAENDQVQDDAGESAEPAAAVVQSNGETHAFDSLDLDGDLELDANDTPIGDGSGELDDVGAFLEERGIDAAIAEPEIKAKKKKNKKKKTDKPDKPRKLKNRDEKTTEKMKLVLEEAKKEARRDLEEEKDEIMRKVPFNIQNYWGEVGFAKWQKSYLPALNLSPYQVPPGEARGSWMRMFEKMQENGRPLEKMSYLVYWYGEENPQNYYSVVPNSSFVKFVDADQKMKNYAKNAQKKVESGKKLTADDQQRLRALEQMNEDLEKTPEQRMRGDVEFPERDELLSLHDVDEYIDENGLDDVEIGTSDEDEESENKRVSQKKKRAKPKETEQDSDGEEEQFQEQDEAEFEPKQTKKKNNKSRRASKPVSLKTKGAGKAKGKKRNATSNIVKEGGDGELEEGALPIQVKGKNSKKRSRTTMETSNIERVEDPDEEGGVVDNPPAPKIKRKKRSDQVVPYQKTKNAKKLNSGEDSEKDGAGGRGKKRRKSVEEVAPKDTIEHEHSNSQEDLEMESQPAETEIRSAKKNKRDKKNKNQYFGDEDDSRDESTQQESHVDMVAQQFKKDEERFVPDIRKWRKAITSGDKIQRVLTMTMNNWKKSDISAAFIEAYQISMYLKSTKVALKKQNASLEVWKETRLIIKELYSKSKVKKEDGLEVQFPELAAPLEVEDNTNEEKMQKVSKPEGDKPGSEGPTLVASTQDALHKTQEAVAKKEEKVQPVEREDEKKLPVKSMVTDKSDQLDAKTANPLASSQDSLNAKIAKKPTEAGQEKPQHTTKPKPPPKRKISKGFSLGSFTKQSKEAATNGTSESTTNYKQPAKKQIPDWVSKPTALVPPSTTHRLMGLEYLREMASQFPVDKVNVDSIAISVEKALHEVSDKEKDETSKVDKYWERLHVLVAGVCGELEPSPLMRLIVKGEIAKAEDLLKMSDEQLFDAFKGKHVRLDSK